MGIKLKDFGFIFGSLLYLELVFRFVLFKDFFSYSLLTITFFSFIIALLIYLFISFFNQKINTLILSIITFALCFIFCAQLIYFKTYDSIFSFYSLKQAGEVMEFASAIVKITLQNIVPIFFLFIPFIWLMVFHKKVLRLKKIHYVAKLFVVITAVIIYGVSILLLQIDKKEMYSPYSLYYKDHVPVMMANKLGLLTAMRIDFKRAIWGFEGKVYTYTKDDTKKKEATIKEPTYKPNVLTIDFNNLINSTTDTTIQNMHAYFRDVEPTYQNEYTGMFKGKNLILILAEALDPIAIDEKITPTLYKMVHEGFNFTNYYTPIFPVSTSDGEYIQQVSLIPHEGGWSLKDSYQNELPFTLAHLLLHDGYKTSAYHGHTGTYYGRYLSIPNLGYQNFYACKMGLNINCKSWPESDVEVMDASVPQYVNNSPFMTYYISISGHLNYTRVGNAMVRRNWDAVSDLPYSDMVKGYLSGQKELDKALADLITRLTAAGQLDNTVIAISPDHYPYGLTLAEINEKSSYVRDDVFEKHKSVFVLWNSAMEPVKVDTLTSNLDVLPTIANLMGLNYDSRLVMGRDILSEHESIVIFSNRSWITDKGRYNSLTKTYTGDKVDSEYMARINKIIYDRFKISGLILEKNYYKYVKY